MKTIIHLTDNTINDDIYNVVKRNQLEVLGDNKLICVSQKPVLEFGKNICIGEIGRSWMSLYKAMIAGLEAAETEYICIAEHDCLYTDEHFNFIPPDKDVFYYNENHWLVQWGGNHPELNGMYSYWRKRHALSQLTCYRDLLLKSTREVINLLELGLKVEKGLRWYGEPGLISDTFKEYCRRAYTESVSGKAHQLQRYLKEYVSHYTSEFFKTVKPNLDIRHGSNFTGPKRGNKRCYDLLPWGKFSDIMAQG